MDNLQKTPQDDSVLHHLRMAAISIRKATSLALGKARAFCRSVVAVLTPSRLKKNLDPFKPSASPMKQRSISTMGPQGLAALVKSYSFAEVDAFKEDFKLRVRDVMDDMIAIKGEKEPELHKKVKSSLLDRIDDCRSLDEVLFFLNDVVPEPYLKRLCMSFLQIGRKTGADLGLSEQGRLWLESMIQNVSFEGLKENLFQLLKSELGQSTEWLAEGFKEYTAKERDLLHSIQAVQDIPEMVLCLDNHFEHCEQYGYLLKLKTLVARAGFKPRSFKVRAPLLAAGDELGTFKEKFFPHLELIHKNQSEEIDSRSGLITNQISALALNVMKASDINDVFELIKQEAPSKHAKNLLTAFKEICEETGDNLQLDPSIRQFLEDRENCAEDTSLDLNWSHVSQDFEMVAKLKADLMGDLDTIIKGIVDECYAKAAQEKVDKEGESASSEKKYVFISYAEVNPEDLPDVKALKALKTEVERCDSYEDMVAELIKHAPEKYTTPLLRGLGEIYENLKDPDEELSDSEEVSQAPDYVSDGIHEIFPPVEVDELKDFEVSLDDPQILNKASDSGKKYNLQKVSIGDQLKITMLKATDDSQGEEVLDDKQDFLCDFLFQRDIKKVFKINIKGKEFAISVPTKSYEARHWPTVLKETQSTERLRQLGFNTLSFHKTVLVEIDGVTVPATVMPLFDDLDGQIADHKNAYILDSFIDDIAAIDQSTGEKFKVEEIPDEEVFYGVLQHAIEDAGILVKNGICLDSGSINYQILESGDVKLFLSDFPGGIIETNHTNMDLCKAYASHLVDSFVQCLRKQDCMKFETGHKNPKFMQRLIELIDLASKGERVPRPPRESS
ncbi:hypothetical protein [Endozoicomonas sp. 4G]|uniref:hypothetical protein n=1 Tax=Endozoicomonas sp. 4G TaxID=2872754 RepID=UPI002078DE5A|nr:hypothetical protein [Endozoicomonas sp. 4G]